MRSFDNYNQDNFLDKNDNEYNFELNDHCYPEGDDEDYENYSPNCTYWREEVFFNNPWLSEYDNDEVDDY